MGHCLSSAAPAADVSVAAWGPSRLLPPRCRRSPQPWLSSLRRFRSTSSPPGLWTRRCRRHCLVMLEERRQELRATLPIGRVVLPFDVAALAVHIMSNTALPGATYDIDGGQQFLA